MSHEQQQRANYEIFRDALSGLIIEKCRIHDTTSRKPRRRKERGRQQLQPAMKAQDGCDDGDGAEELAEFIEYLATELFTSLPTNLQDLSYAKYKSSPGLQDTYSTPLSCETQSVLLDIPPTINDSLLSYNLLADSASLPNFLLPVFDTYLTALTTPPQPYSPASRASACEICSRDWIPLTYHHLIPRAVHDKALKRRWHEEWQLNSVAWLCRACHSFVHRIASNEELAREWWTVERLKGREDVRKWSGWVGRVRWKVT